MNRIWQLSLLVIAMAGLGACAPAEKKDFFECGPNNELVVCPVGETPDAATHGDCRAVGDGDTTLADGTCS